MTTADRPPEELCAWECAELLRGGQASAVELAQALLRRGEALNPRLNCLITATPELALEQARAADARLAAEGDAAPTLCGVPMLHKDIFCTPGVRTSCGSRMLRDWVPPYESTVARLFREQGAVLLGKCNMDEFAMGSSNETSWFGPCRNPWDTERTPGGSSGGSAAAVAAGLAPIATATDTGGSIRQPASHCGVTGIKPTYGRVSRWGMIAFCSSMDQAGIMARDARDAALALQAMAGYDERDSTSVERGADDYLAGLAGEGDLQGLRIGVPREYMAQDVQPQVQAAVEAALQQLRQLGAEVKEVSLPNTHLALPTYMIVASAECSSNLARYDGVHFGFRAEDTTDLDSMYYNTRAEGFGTEVKRRLLLGAFVLSAGLYDAYYRQAQVSRRLMRNDFQACFEQVDLLCSPTCPGPAFVLGSKGEDPVRMYLEDLLTNAANLAGLPAMSIPCGLADGLPVGLQLMAPDFQEALLLRAAHRYQQATDHHLRRPPLEQVA